MSSTALFEIPDSITPENIEDALQQAIELEIATIPVYLYAYYSINRAQDQGKLEASISNDLRKAGWSNAAQIATLAKELAINILVYANKAAGLIMSVVIEEMLHMALTSNVKQAISTPPVLLNKTPRWPAVLPGHIPEFPIHLAKFSQDQLKTFLLIESPLRFVQKGGPMARVVKYHTIGEFYEMIENCLKTYFKEDRQYGRGPQLVPGKGYYGPNSIDTVYYDKKHNPQFPSSSDSGNLVHVVNLESALKALNEVVEQGEGHQGAQHLTPEGEPICPQNWTGKDYDDSSNQELSHFAKFLELYCRGQYLQQEFNKAMKSKKFDWEAYFVVNVPSDPVVTDFPTTVQPLATLTNAMYTYLFLMTEACYHNEGNTQFEVFMFGIHKSMIWLLSLMANTLVNTNTGTQNGKATFAAPAFADYPFASFKGSPKEQIIRLAAAAKYETPFLKDLPDVSLDFKVASDFGNISPAQGTTKK